MAKQTSVKASSTEKPKSQKKPAERTSWLDEKSDTPLIEDYARQMHSFLKAMADGVIEREELQKQEKTLVSLMKKIEPRLDDELHEQVTRLLCEITVYDMMHMLFELQGSPPATRFRG
jgi:hypothetical protein